ncbi:MAG: ornithine carbamoyltransferase [Gemmatales bacterium]|nr:ornithine carbamoyltransferase [Gemmatales bacterium]MDW7995082.1 ornithine carbamoyltransferase [Gemmatales bacterium]
MRHFLSLADLSPQELHWLVHTTIRRKKRKKVATPLRGSILALIFEKPSLRTRVSFEAGMARLGGTSIFLTGQEVGLGIRESLADCARTLSQYVHAIVLRVFRHQTLEIFAQHAQVPVINGLSDREHPCQALGDFVTMTELLGSLTGRTLAFIGDSNNIARSLALGCAMLGVRWHHACPPAFRFEPSFLTELAARFPKAVLQYFDEPAQAVCEADIIYTDVWTSMGQEKEQSERQRAFARYRVDRALLQHAKPNARVMHCLPAHRGEEITDEVLDGPQSVVFHQAANRMHAQETLLLWLLGKIAMPRAFKSPRKAAVRKR